MSGCESTFSATPVRFGIVADVHKDVMHDADARLRYSEEVDRKHPTIKHTAPYRDALYALVTIDPHQGILEIAGTRSEFVGPSPWELGASREELEACSLVPKISDWRFPFDG